MAALVWRFAEFEFEESRRELRRGDTVLNLEGKPKEVLLYLLQNAGRVIESEEIKRTVWKGMHVSDPTVPVALKKIRDAFGDTNRERIVRTVKNGGYTFCVEVSRVQTDLDPLSGLSVGDLVPGRTGWVLTQLVQQGTDGSIWLSKQQFGSLRRVVELAVTPAGLKRLEAIAESHAMLPQSGRASARFSKIQERQFDHVPYLLETDYLGPTLARWAAEQGGLSAISESVRVGIVADIADTIDILHHANLVHGDLSADSVHLLKEESKWVVRLDGLGRYVRHTQADAPQTIFRLVPGARSEQSPLYRAPELEPGTATAAGDVYALGVLLYQCAACTFTEGPMLGWEDRIKDEVLRRDIAATAHMDPAFRMRTSTAVTIGLHELAERRLAIEELTESRRETERVQQQLAAELAKRPLRRALGFSLAVLAVVTAAAVFSHVTALRRERDKAREQQRQAETVQKYLGKLFFDGDAPIDGPITPEGLAQRGLDQAHFLEGEPQVHSGLLNTLGAGFEVLGNYPKAEQVLQRALDERKRAFGPESAEVADTMIQQASLKDDEHEWKQALELGEHALVLQRRLLPANDIAIMRSQTKVAEVLTELGKYDQAAPLLEQAIIQETGQADLLPDLSDSYNDLSILENYRGNLQKCLDLQEKTMKIDRELEGPRHPDIAEHLLTLSNTHDLLGQYAQAAAEAREALSIFQERLPPGHPEVAAAQAHLGTELSHLPASLPEAGTQLKAALRILTLEPERSGTEAYALLGLASVDFQEGHYTEALDADRRSLKIYRSKYAEPQPAWTTSLVGMAAVDYKQQRWQDFAVVAEQAFAIASSTMKADDPRRLQAELYVARLRIRQQRKTDARVLLQSLLSHSEEGNPKTQEVRKAAENDLLNL